MCASVGFLHVKCASHANSSQCEQMLVSNALGFCTTVRHFFRVLGSKEESVEMPELLYRAEHN